MIGKITKVTRSGETEADRGRKKFLRLDRNKRIPEGSNNFTALGRGTYIPRYSSLNIFTGYLEVWKTRQRSSFLFNDNDKLKKQGTPEVSVRRR